MKFLNAFALSFNNIMLQFDTLMDYIPNFTIYNNNSKVEIQYVATCHNKILIHLEEDLNIKSRTFIEINNISKEVLYHKLYKSKGFNDKFHYDGNLGINYTKDYCEFKLWTPAASNVQLCLYKKDAQEELSYIEKIPMIETNGLWYIKVDRNLKNMYYTYEITVFGETNEVVDPYAYAAGVNGLKGYIIDLKETNPQNFENEKSPTYIKNDTDAIIYEASIRDFTSYPSTEIKSKGKYLGLAESSENKEYINSVGLNHLVSLGITHLQLMPFFDFSHESVDESSPHDKYNWGYDPQNYNVPEGSYSTNPYDPIIRIIELKKAIMTLHKHNIYVNMDVVYNHIFKFENSNFQKIFPDYYFRFNENGEICNGSGCGNDIASENSMVRKFILDSVLYWIKEYHIDGFRFDLMGLLDIETINLIKKEIKNINPHIMIYGEGWNLGTNLPEQNKAIIQNSNKMPQVGFFNDFFRDIVKGSVFTATDKGFINGKQHLENQIKTCILGSENLFLSPSQSINYVCCHDNLTIYDKLLCTNKKDSEQVRIDMLKLAFTLIFTSQGIPFIQSGSEFCRSKDCIENSYASPDYINWINWDKKINNAHVVNYVKSLIEFRKAHPAFKFTSSEALKNHIEFIGGLPDNVIVFVLKDYANNDPYKEIMIMLNANKNAKLIDIPSGKWNLIGDKNLISDKTIRIVENSFNLSELSSYILYKNT